MQDANSATADDDARKRITEAMREMSFPQRITAGMAVTFARLIQNGSTMEPEQTLDVIKAVMDAHRVASCLDLVEQTFMPGTNEAELDENVKELGPIGPTILLMFRDLFEERKRLLDRAGNLMEMAANSEIEK